MHTSNGQNGIDKNGSTFENGTPRPAGAARFVSGLILPPPEIKSVIDRTAGFVARSANPPQFEDKIRENQRHDPKFSFLNVADPYHAYYRHRMEGVMNGDIMEEATPGAKGPGQEMQIDESDLLSKVKTYGKEPPPSEFHLDLPNISGVDLDIIKLTALFTALRGSSFLQSLSGREGRNHQFEFLHPSHSLYGYFNRLVEQYTKILLSNQDSLERLKVLASEEGRWKVLEEAREHAEWEKHRREREQRKEDEKEAERIAFAEIDWHDYAIVQTIEFSSADANAELPLPMSVQEVESMTLSQKRMAAMIMENTVEDVEAHRAKQAAAEREAAAAVGGAGVASTDMNTDQTSAEDDEARERKQREEAERIKELERAKAVQATSLDAAGPMKIRSDYVPKLGAKNTKAAMTTCTVCNQQIPVDELQEHMRIELLDPRWKSQRDMLEARKAQASELQRGANIVSSLKHLARTRVDIFGAEADEEKRKQEEEAELARRREREKVVWDGHTASKAGILDKFQTNVNLDEQIAAIHKSKGLGPVDTAALGPGIGPSISSFASSSGLPPPPPSLPMHPQAASNAATNTNAATIASGPQPASMFPQPMMLPPLHYQPNPAQPFGYQPPPAVGMHPSRIAALQGAGGGAGSVRSADEMLAGEGDGEAPSAKRQRVAKLPGGVYYPEQDWINMHPIPISLFIQLPNMPDHPDWKLDGTVATVPDLPLNLLVSTLRDRIVRHIDSTLPPGRVKLTYMGKLLTNQQTIAVYNLEDGDTVVLDVREVKKK
ncbi:Pre-mRNA splicing factor PRP21 like protein-domain-containing protein [Hysterangium stoloniferum]|nr:Pre-mRNA splicing factor PRP21 like protein-domain-containing protein [Hysterangium stoloniferum]